MVGKVRQSNSRSEKTSFLIIDSQSVKNTDTAEQKGYDAGKKVSGIKRHIAVDSQGLPHALHITTANVTDRDGALQAFGLHKDNLADASNVLADGGPLAGEGGLHAAYEWASSYQFGRVEVAAQQAGLEFGGIKHASVP